MKQKKYSIIGLPKEYSENATIHGISYVFSASNAVEKFIWWVIIIMIPHFSSLNSKVCNCIWAGVKSQNSNNGKYEHFCSLYKCISVAMLFHS